MVQEYPSDKYPLISYFIGDVRDNLRLFKGFDFGLQAVLMEQVQAE